MKKNLKVVASILILAVFALSLAGCGSPAPAPTPEPSENGEVNGDSVRDIQERTWMLGTIRPEGSTADEAVEAFIANISENSDGMIKIEKYPNSQLGDYSVVQERIGIGDVEMQLAPASTRVSRDLGIASAPMLAATWDEAREIYAPGGEMMAVIEELFASENIKILGNYPVYFGGIALTAEPNEPANPDVSKGLKIRVPGIKAFELTAEALGFIATPIAFAELFTALQTGIVEGAIGAGAEGYYTNFRDLITHYMPVNNHFEIWFVQMSMDVWNDLSDDEKSIVTDAADKLQANRWDVAEAETQVFEDLLAENGAIVYEFTDEELVYMAEKVRREVWPQLETEFGTEIYNQFMQ
ncbi:MAG: TRAP transporter substrate-binding protein DctP [Bacillota bacterium]|nr:TRAP transporter substrate-binding protein DctP [Bacillota bacterium]